MYTYNQAIDLINNSEINFTTRTLGGRKEVTFYTSENTIILVNSNGTEYSISENIWNKVCARFEELGSPFRYMAGMYTSPKWGEGNPGTVISPYVAALLREVESKH